VSNALAFMKKVLKFLLWILPLISFVLDRLYVFSKIIPFLFKEFFSLNLLRIIWIIGLFFIFKYLYDRLISDKRIQLKAKKFWSVFNDFINFISHVYDRRQSPSEDDKKKYIFYYRKLRKLFSDISYPLLKYLEEKYKGEKQHWARGVCGNIEECFSSPNLEEHFRRKPLRPPTDYVQFEHLIEEFIGYLKYKK